MDMSVGVMSSQCVSMAERRHIWAKAFTLKIREKNMYNEEGDCTPFGTTLHQCNIRRCWNECLLLSDYNKRLEAINEFNRFILVQFSFDNNFSCRIFDIRDH
uniref:Uncharacterized protein n=1 Tax=Parascaris equorum TaxID=6256 RepID=A0A914R5E8_PAREQ